MILRLVIDDDDGRFRVAEFFGHELACDRLPRDVDDVEWDADRL